MIHADCVRCKGIGDEFPIETTTKWILGLGCPEVIIRTDGESSIVALSRRVREKFKETGVKTMHNTSPAYDSISAGQAESGVRIVKEKVRTLTCFAGELHGVTAGKSHVSLLRCVRFAAQKFCISHSGTDGMTCYRRAYARSRMPLRFVLWSGKCKYHASNDVFSRCKSVHKMATGKSDDELIQLDDKMRIWDTKWKIQKSGKSMAW